jgi:ADP-dependent NAD(P)H-hydrate dehydratase / NAD(P)H-hydrate epimerase
LAILERCAVLRFRESQEPLCIAIDISTGLDAASGKAHEKAFPAHHTITMAALKTGLLLNDAPDACGQIHTVPIGIPDDYIAKQARVRVLTMHDVRRLLPARARRSAKHDFGSIAVIGGTHTMAGAPALAANASISAGAGLVRLYAPGVHPAVLPEIMTRELPHLNGALSDNPETRAVLEEAIQVNTAFVIGPGLGSNPDTMRLVRWLVESIPAVKPIVIDADGLRALSVENGTAPPLRPNIVLTPHRGEFTRFVQGMQGSVDYVSVPANAHTLAPEWAARLGCTLLLKNVPTIVSDGHMTYYNTSGNAGMATAGSGDVLSGILGALLAQHISLNITALEATAIGAFLHGSAGDAFAARHGMASLTASGLIGGLCEVLP